MSKENHLAFLSHNTNDKKQVEEIAKLLEKNNIKTWFDKWAIRPGIGNRKEIEKGIKESTAILIFKSNFNFSPWQKVEVEIAINQIIYNKKIVILVLLPGGCPDDPEIPEILKTKAWIDFRQGLDNKEECEKLLWGITGKRIPAILKQYAKALARLYKNIDFLGIPDLRDKKPVPLQSIFVDLECTNYPYPDEKKPIPVEDFFDKNQKLVILGDPGAGKSTLLKFLTFTDAQNLINNKEGYIPIIITLRNYARWRTEPGKENISLLDYYDFYCSSDLSLKIPKEIFEILLKKGQCHVYFDGYDELIGGVVRDDVRKVIDVFCNTRYPENKFTITSRIAGYEQIPFDHTFFVHVKLTPFSNKAINRFVEKWYLWKGREQGLSKIERNESIADLKKSLEIKQIRELGGNPLLLTMIAIIHQNEAYLPQERFHLYEKITEALLFTWDKNRGIGESGVILDKLRIRLAYLAQWMHTISEGKKERQTEIRRREIEEKLTHILIKTEPSQFKEDKFMAREEARNFLEFIKQRAGLLIEAGDGLYRFLHLSFQEYFTALYWFEKELQARIWDDLYLTYIPNEHYKEVLLLLFAMMVYGGRKRSTADILKKCRNIFWDSIGINPEIISRTMRIVDIEKLVQQLNNTYIKKNHQFLIFLKNALNDCIHFETNERVFIDSSFKLIEILYARLFLFILKKAIQNEKPYYDKALTRDFDISRDLAYTLTRDLALNLDRSFGLALIIDRSFNLAKYSGLEFDYALDFIRSHALNRAKVFAHILDIKFELVLDLSIDKNRVGGIFATYKQMQNFIKDFQNTCMNIKSKASYFLKDGHKRYIQFTSLVLLLMGIIISFSWQFMQIKLKWNYPILDKFVDTGGGLITDKT